MINNINSQYSFTGKSPLTKNIKLVKQAFFNEFQDIKKPASFRNLSPEQKLEKAEEIKEANLWLKVTREFNKTAYEEGGNFEVFRRLIDMFKTFKVGNCAEHAEIGKTICKMNNIKNCDIFTLHAKAPDGKVRDLDQTIIAFKVPKSKNNRTTKKNGNLFEPLKNTVIFDLYMNGFSGKVQKSRKIYEKHFGLKPDEKLLFKPENTYEPDIQTIEKLKKEFPQLLINKKK